MNIYIFVQTDDIDFTKRYLTAFILVNGQLVKQSTTKIKHDPWDYSGPEEGAQNLDAEAHKIAKAIADAHEASNYSYQIIHL